MKKFLFFLIGTMALALNAQVTCSTSFTYQQGSSSPTFFQFIDTTASTNTSWPAHYYRLTYDFGDNVTRTISRGIAQSAYFIGHQYTAAGTYTVELKVEVIDSLASGAVLCTSYDYDTIVIAQIINCSASFQWSQASSGSLTMNFQNVSSNYSSVPTYETYSWNFGDGNSSTQQSPSHSYTTSGNYFVVLTYEVRDSATSVILCSDNYSRLIHPGSVDSCGASFTFFQDYQSLKMNFRAHGNAKSYNQIQYPQHFTWDYGDGSTGTGKYPAHTYAQPGTYQITMFFNAPDTINQITFCQDTVVHTVVVTTPPLLCTAFFGPDSSLIGTPNAVIFNYATPSQSNPNYTVNYHWDFGDGDTSVQAFPTHTYSGPGTYNLCLIISVIDTASQTCSDTYCHNITMDSIGNYYYKSTSAPFTINLIDPNTVGQEEVSVSDLEIFPNPASDRVNISGLKTSARWSLYDLRGNRVTMGEIQNGDGDIALPQVDNGLYILNVTSGEDRANFKLQITQ